MVQLAAGKLPVMLPPKPLFEKGAMTPRFPEKWKADFEKAVTDRDENSLILTMKLRFLSEEANKEIDFAHGLLRAFYEKNMERMSGSTTLSHCLGVGALLAMLGADLKTVIGGMLHDVKEDFAELHPKGFAGAVNGTVLTAHREYEIMPIVSAHFQNSGLIWQAIENVTRMQMERAEHAIEKNLTTDWFVNQKVLKYIAYISRVYLDLMSGFIKIADVIMNAFDLDIKDVEVWEEFVTKNVFKALLNTQYSRLLSWPLTEILYWFAGQWNAKDCEYFRKEQMKNDSKTFQMGYMQYSISGMADFIRYACSDGLPVLRAYAKNAFAANGNARDGSRSVIELPHIGEADALAIVRNVMGQSTPKIAKRPFPGLLLRRGPFIEVNCTPEKTASRLGELVGPYDEKLLELHGFDRKTWMD